MLVILVQCQIKGQALLQLHHRPPPADTTPPAVAITSPADNSIATSNIVTVTGTSADSGGSGVKEVAVRIRAGTTTPYTLATPTAPNDWSTWSVTVDLFLLALPVLTFLKLVLRTTQTICNGQTISR